MQMHKKNSKALKCLLLFSLGEHKNDKLFYFLFSLNRILFGKLNMYAQLAH